MSRDAFQIRILPGMPVTKVNRLRKYQRPPTRKEQSEMARQMQSALNCGLYDTRLAAHWNTGKPGWWP